MDVVLKVKILRSLLEKSKGLIGANPIYPVYFTTRWGIHTFGVKSPIDVLILDDKNCIVKIARVLAPNRIFFWNPVNEHVVELPQGTIDKKGLNVGDSVIL